MLERLIAGIGRLFYRMKSYEYTNFILLFLLMVSFKYFDSFGIEDAADRSVATAATSVVGPLYGGHKRHGQKYITIAGIDREALDEIGQDGLPVDYDKQADILDKIASAKPAAIFLDFYYPRARVRNREYEGILLQMPAEDEIDYDPALLRLVERIREIEQVHPVFIGPVGDSPLLAPLKDVGTQVSLEVPAGSFNEYFGSLPVEDAISDGELVPEKPRSSAAVSIYSKLCELGSMPETVITEEGCQRVGAYPDDEMRFFVQWGFGSSEDRLLQLGKQARSRCETSPVPALTSLKLLGRSAFRRAFEFDDRNIGENCTYHDRLNLGVYLDDLDQVRSADIGEVEDASTIAAARIRLAAQQKLINGRVIMVGVDGYGLGDRVEAPLYSDLPGVALHAMALDNLIEADGRVARIPLNNFALSFPDWLQIGFSLTISLIIVGQRRRMRSRLLSGDDALSHTATGAMLFIGVFGSLGMLVITMIFEWSLPMMMTNIVAPGALTAAALVMLAQPAEKKFGD